MPDRRRIEARDAGLERVSRLTQWVLGGGFVASGVVAVVAAHTFGGQSTAPATAADPAAASTATAAAASAAPAPAVASPAAPQPSSGLTTGGGSGGFFQSPSSVPLRTRHRARVTSGGS